jgi:hypothetical protein
MGPAAVTSLLSSLSRMRGFLCRVRPLKDVRYGGKYGRQNAFIGLFTGPAAAHFYAICSSIPLPDACSVPSAVSPRPRSVSCEPFPAGPGTDCNNSGLEQPIPEKANAT